METSGQIKRGTSLDDIGTLKEFMDICKKCREDRRNQK